MSDPSRNNYGDPVPDMGMRSEARKSIYDISPTPYLIVALVLWVSDFSITKFNGLDIQGFMRMLTFDNIFSILTSSFIMLILAIYVLSQKEWNAETMKNVFSMAALLVFLTFIINGGGFQLGNILHLATGLMVYFFILRPLNSDRPYMANIIIIGLFFVDYFLLSILFEMGLKLKLIPVWFYGIYVFSRDMKQTGVIFLLMVLVTGFIIFAFAGEWVGLDNISKTMDPSVKSEFQQMFVDAKSNFLKFFIGIGTSVQDVYNQTTNVYQEAYYTGEIDSNAEKDLGVFIDEISLAQPDFYISEPVSLWATLVVETLENNISVSTKCTANVGHDNELSADSISPEEFDARQYDERPVDCTFNEYSFREGNQIISLETTFDFQTLAYQKKYFINKERANSLLRQDIEPLDYYEIEDKEPKAVYTAGPVMIGIDTSNSLVRIDTEDDGKHKMHIGFTLENIWDGKVDRVNMLRITMPNSMTLDGECSGRSFSGVLAGEGNSYEMDDELIDIKDYKTLRCPVIINDKESILGQAPLAIRYLKVQANYTYTISDSKTVKIFEGYEIEKIGEKTKASEPILSIPSQEMDTNESILINLSRHTYDKETKEPRLFYYEIEDISNEKIVRCKKQNMWYLNCTSNTNTGETQVEVSVNDLSNTNRTTFDICVGILCSDKGDDDNLSEQFGPVKKKSIPLQDIETGKSVQLYLPKYIEDADSGTEVVDMDFDLVYDDYVDVATTRSGAYIWLEIEAKDSCIDDHSYVFTAMDEDDNSEDFTVNIRITGCS